MSRCCVAVTRFHNRNHSQCDAWWHCGEGCLGLGERTGSRVAGCRGTLVPRFPRLRCALGVDLPVPGVLLANRALGLEERSPVAMK